MAKYTVCGRALTAGPGSCNAWWNGCPDNTRHCFNRYIREHGGTIDMEQAEAWDKIRAATVDPAPELPLEPAKERTA
jgi:hypothetical protein